MLLARGGSAVPAAYHLIRGARPGDAQALAGLDRAVTELAPSAPPAAAEPATGALALTLPSDPGRPARTAAAVRALTAAGPWDQTETLVRSALAVPLPASEGAALRCALASLLALTGRAAEAMTEAQTVLTNFDIPADLRDDATVALLWAWLGLRSNRQVDQLAGSILAEPSTKRGAIVVAVMVALGVARWDSGRITKRWTWPRRPSARRRRGPTRRRISALTCFWPRPLSTSAGSTKPPRSRTPSSPSRAPWRAPGRKGPSRSCAPGSPWRRAGSTTRTRWPSQP